MAYDYTQNLFVYARPDSGAAIGLLGALQTGRVRIDWSLWRIVRGDTVRPAGPCNPPRQPVRLSKRRRRHTNLPGHLGAFHRFDFHDPYDGKPGELGYTVLRDGSPCRDRLSLLGALNEYGFMLGDGHAYRVVSA